METSLSLLGRVLMDMLNLEAISSEKCIPNVPNEL